MTTARAALLTMLAISAASALVMGFDAVRSLGRALPPDSGGDHDLPEVPVPTGDGQTGETPEPASEPWT